jgi:multidrug efflux system outer membrane protein
MTTRSSVKSLVIRTLAIALPALMVTACVLGPDYKRPNTPIPNDFRLQIASSEAGSIADLPWWNVFNDPVLQGLVKEALANNHNLEIAVARIEQARTQVEQVESEGRPQIGYEASATGEKSIIPQRNSFGTVTYGAFAGLLNAAWEFDIWGRIRRATESAQANVLAQEDVRRGVILTLVSDVAADYFQLLELDRELAIAEDSARTFKKSTDLFNLRFTAGKDSKLPVQRAQANYDASNAAIQDLKRRITQQEDAISTLVGAYPRAIERGRPLIEQVLPPTPLGSTTALLQRRPDILQAEQVMVSANAQIGVAVANFYPKVGLSTFLGGEGINLAGIWGSFGVWNVAAALAGPIYSGGRLEAEYHERQAFWDETVASYRQTILVAFRETADALAAQQNLGPQRIALENQVKALEQSADLALLRYQSGRASYFEVLEAQQQLFPAQSAVAQAQRDQLIAVVNLYKALGGGWSGTDQAEPVATEVHTTGTGG